MNIDYIIVLLGFLVIISSCKKKETCIEGNGDLTIDIRSVPDFSQINAVGAYNISYSQTNSSRVDLFGDSNVLPIITTQVSTDGLLTIQPVSGECYNMQRNIEVTATSPLLERISLDGEGKIEAHNIVTNKLSYNTNGAATINSSFDTDNLSVTIVGSGDAMLAGVANNAELYIGGEGNIYASSMNTDTCLITIEGVGDVSVHVNNLLTVNISGSGNVYYTGDPEIISNITGSGQLINQN